MWIGGLALGLGGIFLVRASIEAGLLGPGARIVLGVLFAAALLAGGEALRRRTAPVAAFAGAYAPGALTAAGATTAFAVVYAAFALYGFIGPALRLRRTRRDPRCGRMLARRPIPASARRWRRFGAARRLSAAPASDPATTRPVADCRP